MEATTSEKEKSFLKCERDMMEDLVRECNEYGGPDSKILKWQVENADKIRVIPPDYEPNRNNRFIVLLPETSNIKPWVVKSIKMPTINNGKYDDTIIIFRRFIKDEIAKKILKLKQQKNFQIEVKLLDPSMVEVEGWIINAKEITSVDFVGVLDYKDDSFSEIKVTFKTKKLSLKQ
jgi:hypothetical protein